jgi:hypothetical protein
MFVFVQRSDVSSQPFTISAISPAELETPDAVLITADERYCRAGES